MFRLLSIALAAGLLADPAVAQASSEAVPALHALSDLAVRGLTAVDGTTLNLTPVPNGLLRETVAPDGTARRLILTPTSARMGTVAGEGGVHIQGLFLLTANGLAITYADGRSETLVLDRKGEVSIIESDDGLTRCGRWYPAGHRFTVKERRAALAAYARELGLPGAIAKAGAGCAAPKSVKLAAEESAQPQLPRSARRAILDSITARMLGLYATRPAGALASYAPGSSAVFEKFYAEFLAPHEGGYVENDGNAMPANFGINQGANPDIDVAGLSQAQAKQILYERYWLASGADQMPPDLAAVHGDTAINLGLGAASDLLAQSGGDARAYLDLREQRYRAIAAPDSDKAGYLPTWLARNDDLRSFVGGAAADRTASYRQGAQSPMQDMPLPDL